MSNSSNKESLKAVYADIEPGLAALLGQQVYESDPEGANAILRLFADMEKDGYQSTIITAAQRGYLLLLAEQQVDNSPKR